MHAINEGFRVTEHGNILFGREFPKHLQVAFGRNIARLMNLPDEPCKIWIRDMPLNLWDLAYNGHTDALDAYRAECRAKGWEHE